jgi:L-fucose isomerase-like protein
MARNLPGQMKMNDPTFAMVLPVGELDNDATRNKFTAIVKAISRSVNDLVISNPIADDAGARQSVIHFSGRNPDLLVIVPLRGLSAPVIEAAVSTSRVPCLICPVQGQFALPSSTLAIGALRNGKVPVEFLYAPPDSPDFTERFRCIIRTAHSISQLRKSCIGVVGGLFPNLVSCRYEPQMINSRLGITLLPISFGAIRNSILTMSGRNQEVEKFRQEILDSYKIDASDENALEAGVRLHLALKQMALQQKIDGFAMECWSAFPMELGLNPCLGFIEDAYTLACEGDVMLCISLLMVHYLTGSHAYVGDLYDLDLEGLLTLNHCGAPASLAKDKSEVVVEKSQLALERGFETLTCRPNLPLGPVTVFRLYGEDCSKLHLAFGELLGSDVSPSLTARIQLQGNRWDFLEQCFGNHYVVVEGNIRSELKLLSKWLGITVFET